MAHCIIRPLQKASKSILLQTKPILNNLNNSCYHYYTPKRTLISEMHKDAFQSKLLRLLRQQIRYQMETSPPSQPMPEFNSFNVDEGPTEQCTKLTRKFKVNEEIKLEVSRFDASMPVKKPGAEDDEEDVLLHVSMLVNICKGEGNNVLEFACSVWPGSIEIHKVYTRNEKRTGLPYTGLGFKDMDDEIQNSLYEYLEERGIDEELANFIHAYMKNKNNREYVQYLERIKSFIEKK